ncbi:MAG TPA: hypothetical protein VKA70_06950 [Blastocatellia bacterium]|nr:hypothetical protein [Blastocatellia bacterium]
MKESHIITIIEERCIGQLCQAEITEIEIHVADCSDCRRAYRAAQISGRLVRARAAETIEASPFFNTRVMAALRERQLSPELPALLRMWKAAGSLVSAMAAMVVILIALTIFGGNAEPQMQPTEMASSQSIYSPEYVVFEQGEGADDSLAYDQVLTTVYDSEDVDGQ